MNNREELLRWIESRWILTVRKQTTDDASGVIGLPFPYIVPCCKDYFRELYYWDTAFAAWGLIAQGKRELARDCARNMLELVRRYGFVPNAAHKNLLNRSQPPLLGFLCAQVAEAFPEERSQWIREALPQLEAEYDFWMSQRCLPCGLNRYGHNASDEELLVLYDDCGPRRLSMPIRNEANTSECLAIGHGLMAEAESGWDFTPRFERRALDFAPVDLNSILYANEVRLAQWNMELGHNERADYFENAAQTRRRKMNELMFDENRACWFDYDDCNKRRGKVISAAAYFPLWSGISSGEQARSTAEFLQNKLWTPYGVMACAMPPDAEHVYQWDAPKLWPPLQFVAIAALVRCNEFENAQDLACRFTGTVQKQFEETGDLWEKYDGLTGATQCKNAEYAAPAMMGWTAGSYLLADALLNNNDITGAW